ncbi:MAG: hypothetical protein K8T10_07820 [Candidatus Eremiobacteraeota bacterium]|nr:hypothetical protein [Candidatus Eremiobacteraeota bacterium]
MALKEKITISILLAIILVFIITPFSVYANPDKGEIPEYDLLFFRDDGRIWIIMPPKTTFILVFRSDAQSNGYVKCLNSKGETLVIDNSFVGDIMISTEVSRPSLRKNKLVVTRYNGDAVGFYTPPNAAYIEVINAMHGFDGVVTILDKKRRILNRQTGVDLRIIDYRQGNIKKDK